MDMENIDREMSQAHRLYYCKPMCSMVEVVEQEMIAASPGPTPPSEPTLKPPTSSTDGQGDVDVTDPNPAKKYPGFNAWNTWD